MLSKGIKLIILLMLIVMSVWFGTCVYGNFFGKPSGSGIDTPDIDKAAYSIYIENTANVIYTNDFDQSGSIPGQRVYVVKGYWEIQGDDFKYRDNVIMLDERVFGKIQIRRR